MSRPIEVDTLSLLSLWSRHSPRRLDQIPLAFVGHFGACVVRGVIGVTRCLSIGVLNTSVLLSGEAVRDSACHVASAFGALRGDRIQVHLRVPPLVPVTDPLDADKEKLGRRYSDDRG